MFGFILDLLVQRPEMSRKMMNDYVEEVRIIRPLNYQVTTNEAR